MAKNALGENGSDGWRSSGSESSAEAWFRSLVEKVPAVLYVDEADGASSAVYMSPQAEGLLGYSRGEWLEDPDLWVKMLHPDDKERVLALHDRARKSGGPFEAEYRLIARDDSVVWVRDESAPVGGEDGGAGRRAGILLDITERKLYEEKLKESEARYRELFDNAMEGTARISPEGGIVEHCNPAYARALGLAPEEAVGRSFFEFVTGEDEREARRQRELRISGVVSEYEVTVIAADGERKVLTCGGFPLYGPDGAYSGAVQTVSDVTCRRRAEEDMRKSEERFRLVTEATGEAIWDSDLVAGIQEWDGATEALFGYPANEPRTGEWWEERVHDEDKGRVLAGLREVLESGVLWEDNYRFRRADGSYAFVVDRGRVLRDPAGRPVRMVGATADVSGERRSREALEESEQLFRVTFECAPVGLAHVAPDGGWLMVNEELCRITGCTREELLGMSFLNIIHHDDLEDSRRRTREMFASTRPESYSVERRYIRRDGQRIWVRIVVALVCEMTSGEPRRFVCSVEEVTERKLKELVPDPLTAREIEILSLVARWQTDREIAQRLRYSESTIKTHVRRILSKLGVGKRRHAVARAVDIGILHPSQ